jgi:cytochrome b6
MFRDYTFNDVLRRTTTFVAVAIVTLVALSALSGALLAVYYQPAAGEAYRAISRINNEVPFGNLIRGIHDYAGNFVIALGLVQMVLMFVSRQFRQSWLTMWLSGILVILAGIALGWTAMVLGWTQDGFWRLSIELNIIESIPVAGAVVRSLLTGGGGISTDTLQRMYALHSYILSAGAITLAAVHLWGALRQDREVRQERVARRQLKVEAELDRIVREGDRDRAAEVLEQAESESQTSV